MKDILLADPDERSRAMLRLALEMEGFGVIERDSVDRVHLDAAELSPELVLLDLSHLKELALSTVRQIRLATDTPVVVLSDRDETVETVLALQFGADEYIVKPYNMLELIARLHALLRRTRPLGSTANGSAAPCRVAFDQWKLDFVRRELSASDGGYCALTGNEFELLSIFVRQPNRILSRDVIMDGLRGRSWSPLDRGIDMLVRRLRQKIEADPSQPRLIKTVRSAGYLFAVEVAPSG